LEELFDLAVQGKVKPMVEVREFGEVNDVLQRLAAYQVEGRIVVKIPQ